MSGVRPSVRTYDDDGNHSYRLDRQTDWRTSGRMDGWMDWGGEGLLHPLSFLPPSIFPSFLPPSSSSGLYLVWLRFSFARAELVAVEVAFGFYLLVLLFGFCSVFLFIWSTPSSPSPILAPLFRPTAASAPPLASSCSSSSPLHTPVGPLILSLETKERGRWDGGGEGGKEEWWFGAVWGTPVLHLFLLFFFLVWTRS